MHRRGSEGYEVGESIVEEEDLVVPVVVGTDKTGLFLLARARLEVGVGR